MGDAPVNAMLKDHRLAEHIAAVTWREIRRELFSKKRALQKCGI